MAQSTKSRKNRGGRSGTSRRRGGLLTGMRSGFKEIGGAVTGAKTSSHKYAWLGWLVLILLAAGAIGLLASGR